MTDWKEAGRKADAHRVRDLFRQTFAQKPKDVARRRVIEVLRAAGGTRCLDLWGGGISANELTAAGFQVVSVENGSLEMEDRGHLVSASRKRRAFERTASEDGYEARWGKAATFAHEADVAFLDFCGPWSPEVRRTVEACRHMNAVVVTLMTDHDIFTHATTQTERLLAYKVFLGLAFGGPSGKTRSVWDTPGRLLCRYRRETGQQVLVFVVSKTRLSIGSLTQPERWTLDPKKKAAHAQAVKERARERYSIDPEYRERLKANAARQRAVARERFLTDPEFQERRRRSGREYARRHREQLRATSGERPSSGGP